MFGLMNGIFYMIPPWNLHYATKLINRIGINKRNLDKTRYIEEYEEISGICNDTF